MMGLIGWFPIPFFDSVIFIQTVSIKKGGVLLVLCTCHSEFLRGPGEIGQRYRRASGFWHARTETDWLCFVLLGSKNVRYLSIQGIPGAKGVIIFGLPRFRNHKTWVGPSSCAQALSPSTGFQSTHT